MTTKESLPTKTQAATNNALSNWLRNSRRAIWPLAALALILLVDSLISDNFFGIRVVNDPLYGGHLYGNVIDILKNAAPVLLLATGMSLVIATKGIDLSVGAIIAICGAVAAVLVGKGDAPPTLPVPLVILVSIGVGALCGLWNGILVAFFDIQPIVATLILMVAGRGIAQMITQATIATFVNEGLAFLGVGYIFSLPVSIFISLGVLVLVYLLVRRTAIGLMIESVGANDKASYYVGINARLIKLFAYVVSGICAAIAGLIVAANIRGADANNGGLYLELDAILAVVIGGASLNGGRFYLGLSAIGVLIIQSMNTGILISGIQPEFNLVVKAIVVLLVLFIQSEVVRSSIGRRLRRTT
ncbi:MAG: ABC transporter permease [Anaerolineaceae bacterium]|nr:ABC transporter permease [Anaerolineaceae bacterium]